MFTTENLKKNNVKMLTARIFSKILYKIDSVNREETKKLLSIDLLKTQIQKDLLCMTLIRVEETYTKLLGNRDPKELMQKKGEILFLQCTKKSCEDFLTKYYGSKVKVSLRNLKKLLYTKNLIKDVELLFQVGNVESSPLSLKDIKHKEDLDNAEKSIYEDQDIKEFMNKFRISDRETPVVVVPTSYNSVTVEEFIDLGVNIVISANHMLRSSYPAMSKVAESILQNGRSLESEKDCMSIKEILDIIPGTK